MAIVRDLLHVAAQRVGDRNEANLLLAHILGVQRSWLIAHSDDALALEQETRFLNLIARREAGEPVAYLTGSRGFWTLELEVTPATLIPRPETELLVELALARLHESEPLGVIDLGTGSGAIALAIARERPQAQVMAIDASEDALAVARRNADRHGLRNVQFLHGDWLAPAGNQKVAMIVSNPPYIEADDRHLGEGDLRFEPLSALASGADGLDDIRRIITSAARHLLPNGHLLLEHGWQQGHEVRQLLKAAGFVEVASANDLEQRERVTLGMWPVLAGRHMPVAPH